MRSIWSGYIKFGTIFIPIRLYAASENLHIGFHLVHKTDCGRVHYKKVCEKDNKELETKEIVKAIDIAGECIQFTDEELKNIHPFSTRTMKILGFCEYEEIPQISLSKPYYLGTENPKKGGGYCSEFPPTPGGYGKERESGSGEMGAAQQRVYWNAAAL
ncbi:MAG: end-binding protein Ku [Methanobacterium sp.]|jgi:DNA end-binding protein Ku|uniref:Ku protein n=1 Tax=Methanobacterium sp. TaxID=2164 RepID=UPI0024AB4419|nr:Ku protein [Methanobacterium sp.]MDI3550559.1 end-binding protein Ku [Methanobacterium sp.]